jgi:hypothetical protein
MRHSENGQHYSRIVGRRRGSRGAKVMKNNLISTNTVYMRKLKIKEITQEHGYRRALSHIKSDPQLVKLFNWRYPGVWIDPFIIPFSSLIVAVVFLATMLSLAQAFNIAPIYFAPFMFIALVATLTFTPIKYKPIPAGKAVQNFLSARPIRK